MLSLKLDKPSQHLKTLRLFNFPATQELLNVAAVRPNLERLVIANLELGSRSLPEGHITDVPAPVNAGNMKTWAFNCASVETLAGWNVPELDNLMMSQTGMDHIPPRLLTGRKLLGVTARHNRIGDEAAVDVLWLFCGNAQTLELTGNQTDEVPLPPVETNPDMCYHSETAAFAHRCGCSSLNITSEEPMMLIDYVGHINHDKELRSCFELLEGNNSEGLLISLNMNPLHN